MPETVIKRTTIIERQKIVAIISNLPGVSPQRPWRVS
jgi:hypothetical protein